MRTEVLTTGFFNRLHPGHIELLEFASKLGKVTVGLNADPFLIEKYKDFALPLIDRIYIISSIRFVDRVVVFWEKTPAELILKLKPKYFIKGPDYQGKLLPEQYAIDEVGAKLLIHTAEKKYSSTALLHREAGIDLEHSK